MQPEAPLILRRVHGHPHALRRSQISSKSVAKRGAAEKVGVFARVAGRPAIVEYSELTDAQSKATAADGSLVFGQGSIAASCIWEVVGLEVPITRWSVEEAGLTRQVGSGVLLAGLGILAFHFSGRRSAA